MVSFPSFYTTNITYICLHWNLIHLHNSHYVSHPLYCVICVCNSDIYLFFNTCISLIYTYYLSVFIILLNELPLMSLFFYFFLFLFLLTMILFFIHLLYYLTILSYNIHLFSPFIYIITSYYRSVIILTFFLLLLMLHTADLNTYPASCSSHNTKNMSYQN